MLGYIIYKYINRKVELRIKRQTEWFSIFNIFSGCSLTTFL